MIKRRFARTNKRNFISQLTAAEVRFRFMQRIARRLAAHAKLSRRIHQRRPRRQKRGEAENDGADVVDSIDTTQRYNIADSNKEWYNILEWVHTNRTDVATKVQLWYIRAHILTS